jgi:hypothetical protein
MGGSSVALEVLEELLAQDDDEGEDQQPAKDEERPDEVAHGGAATHYPSSLMVMR